MRPSGPPLGVVRIPEAVRRVAEGRDIEPVWRNELGGLAFRVGRAGDGDVVFVKWAEHDSGLDLAAEATRLEWARAYTPVPEVLAYGNDGSGWWLATAGLDGEDASSLRWRADPLTAVRAIGAGLRRLHDALPVEDCPFDWSVDERLRHGGIAEHSAGAEFRTAPPIDRLVVCHGDACAPNTLIADDGRFLAHVDLGRLGVADRWADIAIATLSTQWNYGPGWEEPLLDAYGIDPDPVRTDFYRRLWDAT
ncbi:aminoglycoside 3'-phosphotransferase [Herbiconiux sp. L3-i23]|uniref:aminoglycoside 3'-phosphotransferase n=1 Tax=Herbiconiux sp. L3-i23 TaxID=2905871 RepID=UPI002073CD5A|nr:aminoglycoside 3'-phosphotransferase [Herbiconiux sp. L3-i23]